MDQQRCCVGGCHQQSDDHVLVAVDGQIYLAPVCELHADDVRFGDHPAMPETVGPEGVLLRLSE